MIKRLAKYLFSVYLYYLGGFSKHIKKLQKTPCVNIIYFHNPSPDEFEKYIKWLKAKNFGFISQEEIIDFINGKIELNKCHIWVTLDDGWRGNLKLVPVVEKYNIPITIFVTTYSIETGFFRGSLEKKLKHLLPDNYANNVSQLKEISNAERSAIDEKLFSQAKEKLKREALTKIELINLSNHDMVNIGLHTHTHPNLTKCGTAEIQKEITTNAIIINELLNLKPSVFALPYGKFNDEVIKALGTTNAKYLFTTKNGIVTSKNRKQRELPRNGKAQVSFYENCCRMLDYWYPSLSKRKKNLPNSKF